MPAPTNTRRSNGRWLLPLIAIFSLTALLAAACGGDDSDGGSAPTQTPGIGQTPAGDQTATPTATQTPSDDDETPTPAVTPDGDSTSDGLSQELQALASGWANRTAKVTYELSSQGQGEDFTSEMTLYWRFPDWRVDISSTDTGDVTMIVTGRRRPSVQRAPAWP